MALFFARDLHGLGSLADSVRRRRHGDKAYYNINRHINYSNVCELSCEVCGFGQRRGSKGRTN